VESPDGATLLVAARSRDGNHVPSNPARVYPRTRRTKKRGGFLRLAVSPTPFSRPSYRLLCLRAQLARIGNDGVLSRR
jgi:hypothetical protein